MKNLIVFVQMIALLVLLSSCNSRKGAMNMKLNGVYWGGRAVAVTVNPANDNTVWVATESGGVFTSQNGGIGWRHIDSLPQFDCFDIKISPADPNVIIATFREDTRNVNGGGIWVSRDGGIKWERPPSSIPMDASGKPRRFSAYGISFTPFVGTVYVGTDYGFAVSPDLGISWSYINPKPDNSKNWISSIVSLLSGKVITYGQEGIMYSDNGKNNWKRAMNEGTSGGYIIHNALAVSPLNENHIFFTNNNDKLSYSVDGGKLWKPVNVHFTKPGSGLGSRQPFVRVVPSVSRKPGELDLYYSQNKFLAKKTISSNGADYDFSASWELLRFHHVDPSDLAFSKDGKTPLYETDDGGISKAPGESGMVWEQVGSASNGFNALQIYNVKGVINKKDASENQIYFSTQDNDIWASPDAGITWPKACCIEGTSIQGPVDNAAGGDIIFSSKGNNITTWNKATPILQSVIPMSKPFDWSTECIYVRPGVYFTFTTNLPDRTSSLYVTYDAGISWKKILDTEKFVVNYPVIAGTSGNPSIIAPFTSNAKFQNPSGSYWILRIDNVFNGISGDEKTAIIPYPTPLANMGVVSYQFASYVVFGVDPNDPDFIMMPDIKNNQMLITTKGGNPWEIHQGLTSAVTNNGKYLFATKSEKSQVSSIQVDPGNSNHILIGNIQSGILFSNDRGNTWFKMKNSELIPYVYSFFFTNSNEAIASSFGRGLWKIPLRAGSGIIRYPTLKEKKGQPMPVDQAGAERDYHDTTGMVLYLQTIENKFTRTLISGSKNWLVGRRLPGKLSLRVTADDDTKDLKIYWENKKDFKVELPIFYQPGTHLLKLSAEKGKELIMYFEVVPADNSEEVTGR